MQLIERLAAIGRDTIGQISGLGYSTLLLWRVIRTGFSQRSFLPTLLRQLYSVGVLSLPITLVSGLFIGMVIALQAFNVLVDYGVEQSLGPMVALSLLRELGPVVAALLFAGRAGSALTAEIGLMKATEQLSSLEMMAVDPVARVLAPRFWAGVLSMPMLATLFVVVGIYGGKMIGVDWLGLDHGSYWSLMQEAVEWGEDIGNMLLKSLIFAIIVTWIAVYRGYRLVPTAEGIALGTTQTVVQSSLMVLGSDFILTALMFG